MERSYQAYREYRKSGLEWFLDLPSSWELSRLKFEAAINMGQSPSSDDFNKDGVGLPFLQGNAEFSKVYPVPKQYCNACRKVADRGDILFSVRAPVGALNLADRSYGIGRGLCAISARRSIHDGYLTWLLQVSRSQLDSLANGSTFDAVTAEQLGNVAIPLPSLDEQFAIADFLDYETAKIDTLIDKQQQLIKLLKEKRQAVISHAVTKGLNRDAAMKDSRVEWLGEVPEHWTLMRYRYATQIYRGKFGHRPRNDPAFYDGDYPFIQTGDIARAGKEIKKFSQTLNQRGKLVSQKFPAGTLVMAIAANIGDTAILGFEAYAPDSVVGFKPTDSVDVEFLRYSLMAALPALEQTSTQSTQANLNIDRIGSVQATFPPIDEQKMIVSHLDKLIGRYDHIEEQVASAIILLQERRTALISAAVTGKIDVRNWQPEKTHHPMEASAGVIPSFWDEVEPSRNAYEEARL